jgi:hypothetical protein
MNQERITASSVINAVAERAYELTLIAQYAQKGSS